MLKNNMFSHDDDGERLERVLLLSENIDDHALELGIVAPKLLECQTAGADWTNAITVAGVEDGESQEATETLKNALKTAHEYYVNAKDVLLAIIYGLEKPDEIIEEYGVKGEAPWDYDKLNLKINKWIETNNRLTALLPPDPRVVNPTIILGLQTQLATITDLWHDAQEERREMAQAYAIKQTLFDKHSKLLTFVFSVAKMTWGNDDPKLTDLGFVPKSQIWTPGQPEPEIETPWPGPVEDLTVEIDPIGDILINWKNVSGAVSYNLLRAVVTIGLPAPVLPFAVYKTGIPPLEEYGSYTDTDHESGNAYYYSVVAVNDAAEETAPCAPVGVDFL